MPDKVKNIKTAKLRITMPDGSKWDVPVLLIAQSRAKYYAEHDGVSFIESLEEDTLPLFTDNPYEIHDYAANNMNWEDVKEHAVKVSDSETDFQEGWMNGEYEIVGD